MCLNFALILGEILEHLVDSSSGWPKLVFAISTWPAWPVPHWHDTWGVYSGLYVDPTSKKCCNGNQAKRDFSIFHYYVWEPPSRFMCLVMAHWVHQPHAQSPPNIPIPFNSHHALMAPTRICVACFGIQLLERGLFCLQPPHISFPAWFPHFIFFSRFWFVLFTASGHVWYPLLHSNGNSSRRRWIGPSEYVETVQASTCVFYLSHALSELLQRNKYHNSLCYCMCCSVSLLTPQVRSMISGGLTRGQMGSLNADLVMTHQCWWHLMNKQWNSACGRPRLSKCMNLTYRD